ncbi:histidine kinase [Nibrella saemangeumensis]|uniref:Histidine kinase n=1 Tax=Nibrella saemangeumensis TaxID=1084526 RepID=A0ABP8NLE5_9BACT
MQNNDLSRLERKLLLIGILLFVCAWYVGEQQYRKGVTPDALLGIGSILALASVQWLITHRVLLVFRDRYPHYSKTLPRILFSLLVSGTLGMITGTLISGISKLIVTGAAFTFEPFSLYFSSSFFFSALIIGAHEVLYNFYELRRLDQEREALKKAHLQSQFDSLKTQVNPHFLFNSINTVLSLIHTAPAKAETFLIELSSVYRYLLQTSENELATLQQELQFTQSYFHLLKMRFGEAIRLDVTINPEWMNYLLPSLTLQLLLENAVKHNIVSLSRPLTISLQTQQDPAGDRVFLRVQNNLQRKPLAVASSRMGLTNILAKFRLLNQNEVIITDQDGHFTVILPLLKSKPYERPDH